MLVFSVPRNYDVPRLAAELNRRPDESVRNTRSEARAACRALGRVSLALVCGGALMGGFLLFSGFWVVGVVCYLLLTAGAYLLKSSARRHARIADLLTPLSRTEFDALRTLAEQSDVVQVMWRKSMRFSRSYYLVDLVYARNLMVREMRNGAKDSDHLPLELTRSLLQPS